VINAAIVGLGRWGQHLVDSVHEESEAIRFVAGVVRHPERVAKYAEAHGFEVSDDLDAVLAMPEVDAVVLATPHRVHAEQIIAAANAGKHVFVEKPFTLTRASAVEAAEAAQANGVTLAVGFNWRFQPAIRHMLELFDDDDLFEGGMGKLLHLEGNFSGPSVFWYPQQHWRQDLTEGPAGGMTGRGVHVLDAMIALTGRVRRVTAHSSRRALEFGLDDTTSALLEFESGASATLTTVIATAETWRLQVMGTGGWAEVGDIDHLGTWELRTCHVHPDNKRRNNQPQTVSFAATSTERAELEHFAEAAEVGRPLARPDGDEVHGVAVFEAIVASAASGMPVEVAS
jgi:predicted dehydrogenase